MGEAKVNRFRLILESVLIVVATYALIGGYLLLCFKIQDGKFGPRESIIPFLVSYVGAMFVIVNLLEKGVILSLRGKILLVIGLWIPISLITVLPVLNMPHYDDPKMQALWFAIFQVIILIILLVMIKKIHKVSEHHAGRSDE